MDKVHYNEMIQNLHTIISKKCLKNKKIILFGHCNATEELVDVLKELDVRIECILDNNEDKWGRYYRGVSIKNPEIVIQILDDTVVLIVARAYEAMKRQLRDIGYAGEIHKLVSYDSFTEYSLSKDTIVRMQQRIERGDIVLDNLKEKYPATFRIFCPFSALGDIYIMMSYLPHFLEKRGIETCVVTVVGNACAKVVRLFGMYPVEVYSQKDMDEMIQAALYTEDKESFIAHQDRPYVVNLHKALHIKCIPLDQIYCCGVFGLPKETKPILPTKFELYQGLESIERGNAVIFSPYAKSVIMFSQDFWKEIVDDYLERGFQCYTNVVEDEKVLDGTLPISPSIAEIHSVVERAGHFVGIRSGLCDVIRDANCEKIALYPDYNYSDTKWKAIDMYALDGWKNIIVKEDFKWNRN